MRKEFIVSIDFEEENDFCESDLHEAIIDGLANVGNYDEPKLLEINQE